MLTLIAWRDIQHRPMQHSLTAFVVAISVALAVAVMLTAVSAHEGLVSASMPFDMIVGAKGSPNQLVFNTIFLQDVPIGNIPNDIYEELKNDDRVSRVIPIGLGDNYMGYRIVGTDINMFDMRPTPQEPPIFQLDEGRYFQNDFEVVIGSTVAEKISLRVGDTFKSSHGVIHGVEDEEHEELYKVVGILKPMYRPYDTGIFVSMGTVWNVHEGAILTKDYTALIVTPKDYVGLMSIYQEINAGKEAQAVFPGAVMGDIFAMIGQGEMVLSAIAYVVMLMALITVMVSLYWSTMDRMRDNAVLRAIGAGRRSVFGIVIIESLIITVVGIVIGIAAGHGISHGLSQYLRESIAIYSPVFFNSGEITLAAVVMLLGTAAGMIPAFAAYRTDVARNLSQ